MRLIHTSTLEVQEFISKDVPPYAVLSHTWGREEVTFEDMKGQTRPSHKEGYQKIVKSSKEANSAGLQYIWIDTACIDKTNGAELSEAINSMFRWYQDATVCFIYLADIQIDISGTGVESQFLEARWFTRGWTLQELIASDLRIFLCSNWTKFGVSSKAHLSLPTSRVLERLRPQLPDITSQLAQITGIAPDVLKGCSLRERSIAEKMSWAARRETTRVEDEAYCLMGIFEVNMPLLYGEGRRAFIRLQEELLKSSDDQSLLAHISPPLDAPVGLLAQSPAFFALSGDIRTLDTFDDAITATKKGLKLHSMVFLAPDKSACLSVLACSIGRSTVARPALYLERSKSVDESYHRLAHRSLLILSPQDSGSEYDITWRGEMPGASVHALLAQMNISNACMKILQVPYDRAGDHKMSKMPTICLQTGSTCLKLLSVEPKTQWDDHTKTFLPLYDPEVQDAVQAIFQYQEQTSGREFAVLVGFVADKNRVFCGKNILVWMPWCSMTASKGQPAPLGDPGDTNAKTICPAIFQIFDLKADKEHSTTEAGKTQVVAVDLSSSLPFLVGASVRSLTFLDRQDVILKVQTFPRPPSNHET